MTDRIFKGDIVMDHGTATLRKLILPLSAIALLGLIVACNDDPTEPATLGVTPVLPGDHAAIDPFRHVGN